MAKAVYTFFSLERSWAIADISHDLQMLNLSAAGQLTRLRYMRMLSVRGKSYGPIRSVVCSSYTLFPSTRIHTLLFTLLARAPFIDPAGGGEVAGVHRYILYT